MYLCNPSTKMISMVNGFGLSPSPWNGLWMLIILHCVPPPGNMSWNVVIIQLTIKIKKMAENFSFLDIFKT